MSKVLKLDGDLLKITVNELSKVTELKGIPFSRFTELNRIFKGFRTHELTVLSGNTGVGKTTFMCEYSLDLAEQGVPTLWGSFETPLRKVCKTLVQQFAGEPLDPPIPSRITDWAHMFSQNVPMYFMNLHGAQSVTEVLKTMEIGVKDVGVEHIIIDNIQFVLGADDSAFVERFQRQDRFVQKLRAFATEKGAHITVVAHPRKEEIGRLLTINSLYGGGKISQEADNIMLIQVDSSISIPKKYVQVVKNRYDGTLGCMDLNFRKDRLSYRPRARELVIPTKATFPRVVGYD
ncbi:Twinkle protein isoform 3 [Schistosoma japonicum]|uniref:Twinkle protein isoform 3 n=2 Tax=Schistosoma japonicum TaxID=6182 RepID=A0A4Z2CYB5_SCHJA|nr:Twinkle protein isoform 3 [Schistosoma japonicum]